MTDPRGRSLFDVADLVILLGAVLIVGGVALWSLPAASIVAGVLAVVFGLSLSQRT